ncbi:MULTISPECIES: NUDIX hydrolase [Avibacterium]|uniref:Mutator mutT protein n=2 Tax=Avibacterium TaxID=292486 RepID=A0A3S4KY76_AVIVO|nr:MULTISPECIES: NUDIX domain-containing protein [Avibacterium]VEB25125.1 mutator mutT protein [Avibacterium volantium]
MKTQIDKLAWLYIKDKQVLMARSKGKEKFYLPGGKREQGESDQQALMREIKEELGIDLIENSLQRIGAFSAQADGKNMDCVVTLTCYKGDFIGDYRPESEIAELAWIGYQDKEKCSLATQKVLEYLKQQGTLE